MPEPQPKSSTRASCNAPSSANESSHCRHSDVVGCVPEPKARPGSSRTTAASAVSASSGSGWFHGTIQVRRPKCSGTYWSIHARSQSWSSTVRKRACDQSSAGIEGFQRGEQQQCIGVVREQRAAAATSSHSGVSPTPGSRIACSFGGVRVGIEQGHRQRADVFQRGFVARLLGFAAAQGQFEEGHQGSLAFLGGAFEDPVLPAMQQLHAAVQVVQREGERAPIGSRCQWPPQHRLRDTHAPATRTGPGTRPPTASASGCCAAGRRGCRRAARARRAIRNPAHAGAPRAGPTRTAARCRRRRQCSARTSAAAIAISLSAAASISVAAKYRKVWPNSSGQPMNDSVCSSERDQNTRIVARPVAM